MYGHKTAAITVFVAALLLASAGYAAETWTLGEGDKWEAVSQSPHARYLLAVSELKKVVAEGDVEQLSEAVARLKRDFPEVAGPDLDSFLEGERYYAEGSFTKAVRAYDTFLARYPESPLYDAALDRELSIAQAYLSGHTKKVLKFINLRGYAEGVKIADNVIDRAGDSPLAIRASLAVVDSYEKRAKYEDAYERWSLISSRWPTGQIGKDAMLGMARCKHAAYRGPRYDSSALVSAKSYYENFRTRYPDDARKYEIDKRLEQITEQLSYKEYTIANFYERTGNEESADIYCDYVVSNWPQSTGAKMAKDIAEEKNIAESEQEKK